MELNDSLTIFMVPFQLKGVDFNTCDVMSVIDEEVWEPSSMKMEKDVLYPHVQSFLMNSLVHKGDAQSKLLPHDYRFFSLRQASSQKSQEKENVGAEKGAQEPVQQEQSSYSFNDVVKVLNNETMSIMVNGRDIPFKILSSKSSFSSIQMVIVPSISFGVLLIGVALDKKKKPQFQLSDLIDLNYALHKTGEQDVPIVLAQQRAFLDREIKEHASDNGISAKENNGTVRQDFSENQKNAIIKKLGNMQLLYERVDASHLSQKSLNEAGLMNFVPCDKKEKKQDKKDEQDKQEKKYDVSTPWTMNALITLLLSQFHGTVQAERCNGKRCHLFTIYLLKGCECNEELLADFSRVVHVENSLYKVLKDDAESYCQTFDNIYMGASVEGSALMLIDEPSGTHFVQEFITSQFQKRYFWIYLMVFVQRHTLIYLLQLLSQVDDTHTQSWRVSLKRLRDFVKKLAEVKVNTYYTDVSDYSHHNKFYSYCSEKLGIVKAYNEIDKKMETLNEHLLQLSTLKKEETERRLSFLVLILTIVSALNDGTDWLIRLFDESQPSRGLMLIPIIVILLIFGYIEYKEMSKS